MSTPTEGKQFRVDYLHVLPDPPWVNFGKSLWRYSGEVDGSGSISVDAKAVAKLIRAALTDDVLSSIGGDALIGRDASQSSYWKEIREGIVSAIVGETTNER